MKKVVNLADKKEAYELLKQLYGDNDKDVDKKVNTQRSPGTKSPGYVVEVPPLIEELFL